MLSFHAEIRYTSSLLLLLSLSAGILGAEVSPTTPGTISLGRVAGETGPVFNELDIIPIDERNTLITLRETDTSDPLYTVSVSDVLLTDLLAALATSLEQRISTTTTTSVPETGSTRLIDELAASIRVSVEVEQANITRTLDQVAIASHCNIYLDDQVIVVDQCR